MWKISLVLLFLISFLNLPALAKEEGEEVLLAPEKYTIIRTTHNYSPIREEASVNSKRFSHLKKGATIFSDKENNDFYRIDLGLDKYYWIEKRYVDIDSKTEAKKLPVIKKIKVTASNDYYLVKIKTPVITAYNEIETSENSLDFILYDCYIDNKETKIISDCEEDFKISKDEFDNLKISYSSNYPLSGHEVVVDDDTIVLKIKKPFKIAENKPLKNITVVIDPGHGGSDSGACAFNLREKDLNLEISNAFKNALEEEGARVILTREDDVDVNLYDRIDFAKEQGGDFLISIHQNSLANIKNVYKKHGVGVYYYNKEAYKLAEALQNSLLEGTKFRDDGVNLASFALTRSQNPVCVLVECGYIIHKEESKKLSDPEFQKVIAKYLTEGLKKYLVENYSNF